MPRCLAKNCFNRSGNKTYFQFPNPDRSAKEKKMCKLWIDKLMNDELDIKTFKPSRGKVVCEDHFEPDCFEGAYINDVAKSLGFFSRKRLKPGSFPTRINTGAVKVFSIGRESAAVLEKKEEEQIINQLETDNVARKLLYSLDQSTSNEEGRTSQTSTLFITPETIQAAGVETNPVKFWTHYVCALSNSKQSVIPTRGGRKMLFEAGLGMKKIWFVKSADHKMFKETLERVFPRLKTCGGYELLRTAEHSRCCLTPLPMPPEGYSSLYLADYSRLGQAVCYVRPKKDIYIDLTYNTAANDDDSDVEEICLTCGACVPLELYGNHIRNCGEGSENEEMTQPPKKQKVEDRNNQLANGQGRKRKWSTYRLISPVSTSHLPEVCPCLQPLSCHCVPLEDEEEADMQMWIKQEDSITGSHSPICCEDNMAGQQTTKYPFTDLNMDNSDLRYSRNRRWMLKKLRFLWLRNDHTYIIHPDFEFRKEDDDDINSDNMESSEDANTLSPGGSREAKFTNSNEDRNLGEDASDVNMVTDDYDQMAPQVSKKSLAHNDESIVNTEQFEVYMDIAEDDYFEYVQSPGNLSVTGVSQIEPEKHGEETSMASGHNIGDRSSSELSCDVEPNVSNKKYFLDDQSGHFKISHEYCDQESDQENIMTRQKDFLTLVDYVKGELDSEFVVYATCERLSIMLMHSHRPCATIKLSIEISCDFRCEVFVQQKPLLKTHEIWNNLPSVFSDFVSVLKLCKRVKQYEVCRGNFNEEFRSIGNGPVYQEMDLRARREESTEYTEGVRSECCSLLTILERCPHCQALFDGRLIMRESTQQKKQVSDKYHPPPDHKPCNKTIEKLLKKINQQNIDIHIMQEELLMGKWPRQNLSQGHNLTEPSHS